MNEQGTIWDGLSAAASTFVALGKLVYFLLA